jgi:hypothetical protein
MPGSERESRRFAHRRNADGTIDSICPICFVTVHTATCESDLSASEREHACDPVLLKIRQKRLPEIDLPPQQSEFKTG